MKNLYLQQYLQDNADIDYEVLIWNGNDYKPLKGVNILVDDDIGKGGKVYISPKKISNKEY